MSCEGRDCGKKLLAMGKMAEEKEHILAKGCALRIMSIVRFFRLEQPDNTVSLRSERIGKRH